MHLPTPIHWTKPVAHSRNWMELFATSCSFPAINCTNEIDFRYQSTLRFHENQSTCGSFPTWSYPEIIHNRVSRWYTKGIPGLWKPPHGINAAALARARLHGGDLPRAWRWGFGDGVSAQPKAPATRTWGLFSNKSGLNGLNPPKRRGDWW